MQRCMVLRILLVFLLSSGFAVCAMAQSVFDMPRLFPKHLHYLERFITSTRQGDLQSAEVAARAAAKIFPKDANWHYNVACVCAKSGQKQEALNWLKQAILLGFTDSRQLESDGDLESLRALPEFHALLEEAKACASRPVKNPTLAQALAREGVMGRDIEVDATDTQWNWDPSSGGYMTTLLSLRTPAKAISPSAYQGPEAELVRPMLGENACGGLLYVNRDEDRSAVRTEAFPALTSVIYGAEAQEARAHLGMANGVFSSGISAYPVVGSASLVRGSSLFWRSIAREIASDARATITAFRLAMANQLYIYDATLDVSPAVKGDVLYNRNPAFLLSADCASEKPNSVAALRELTELVIAVYAVIPPATRAEMIRRGLFVPTVQRLLRQHVKGAPNYFSREAHPVVFEAGKIDQPALLRDAHALTPKDLPPFFQLVVRSESMPVQFVDYFDLQDTEGIADTPLCITRIVRGRERTRRLTVEAVSQEPGLTYRWFAVSGDPAQIRIRPLLPSGAMATLEADYPDAEKAGDALSRRVDIACVAVRADGTASAPAFVSFRRLANEKRTYDAQGRIATIDYLSPLKAQVYEDPALTLLKSWRDDYLYDAGGRCTGWKRTRQDGSEQLFDVRGRRVVEVAPDGSPKRVVKVSYMPRLLQAGEHGDSAIELVQVDDGEPVEATP